MQYKFSIVNEYIVYDSLLLKSYKYDVHEAHLCITII